jgi:hypothetical protein
MVKNSDLRFMDYLSLQRFAPSTKEAYFGAVKGLADYYSTRQPDILSVTAQTTPSSHSRKNMIHSIFKKLKGVKNGKQRKRAA